MLMTLFDYGITAASHEGAVQKSFIFIYTSFGQIAGLILVMDSTNVWSSSEQNRAPPTGLCFQVGGIKTTMNSVRLKHGLTPTLPTLQLSL